MSEYDILLPTTSAPKKIEMLQTSRQGGQTVAILALAVALPAQTPDTPAHRDDIVARFVVAGRSQGVSGADLALELAGRFGNGEDGEHARNHIIDRCLVETAAAEAGLSPSTAMIDKRIEHHAATMRANGSDLSAFLRERHMSRAEFGTEVGLSIAHEQLVRRSLDLPPNRTVAPKLLELWLKEARHKTDVVTDPARLRPGVVAQVGPRTLTLLDLGAALAKTATSKRREKFIRQIIAQRLLEAEAERYGIEVTVADGRAEVARREREIEADPRFAGVSYARLLESQGTDKESIASSPVFLAQIRQERISHHRFDRNSLERELQEQRAAIEARLGQQRHIHIILVRANDGNLPGEFVDRDFAAAAAEIAETKRRIADGMSFADAARVYSDDPYTKVRGGEVGMRVRAAEGLPREVLDAAFTLPLLQVSDPVKTSAGYYLAQVSRIGAQPTDDELLRRLRREHSDQHLHDLLAAAQVQID